MFNIFFTGHATAQIVTDTYAHMQVNSRRSLAEKLERDFYQEKPPSSAESAVPVDAESLLLMIQQNPELKNFLLAGVLADESTKVQQMQN